MSPSMAKTQCSQAGKGRPGREKGRHLSRLASPWEEPWPAAPGAEAAGASLAHRGQSTAPLYSTALPPQGHQHQQLHRQPAHEGGTSRLRTTPTWCGWANPSLASQAPLAALSTCSTPSVVWSGTGTCSAGKGGDEAWETGWPCRGLQTDRRGDRRRVPRQSCGLPPPRRVGMCLSPTSAALRTGAWWLPTHQVLQHRPLPSPALVASLRLVHLIGAAGGAGVTVLGGA